MEIRQQEKKEEEKYKRMELLEKYTAKLLYGQDNKEFEEEYLRKLERNWRRWKDNQKEVEREELEWEREEQVEKIIQEY